MSELLKYGSVGGVGRKPGPYPALDAETTILFRTGRHGRGASEFNRWAT